MIHGLFEHNGTSVLIQKFDEWFMIIIDTKDCESLSFAVPVTAV